MDFLTGRAIRDIIGSLKGQLPAEVYKKVAPLLSDLVAVLERAHDEERRQLRAERSIIDKEREAVNFARHSLDKEREALAAERDVIEREKRLAQRWREAEGGLGAVADSVGEPPAEPPDAPEQDTPDGAATC